MMAATGKPDTSNAAWEPNEGTPVEEVFQQHTLERGLPVEFVGPQQVQPMPARFGGLETYPLALAGAAVQIAGRDDKRKRLLLVCDQDWQIARQASDTHGAFIPSRTVLTIEHVDPVYALATSTAGTLTVITESWAD